MAAQHDEETLIRLGRIEGKLDTLADSVTAKLKDHEERLRRGEKTIYSVGGAVALIGAKISWPHLLALFPH